MLTSDAYILDIKEKAYGSGVLSALAVPTLQNGHVRAVGGLNVLEVPAGHVVVGHTSGGNLAVREGAAYAETVFHALRAQASRIGATPVATACVIDAQSTDEDFVRRVGGVYADLAKRHGVAILNGELAKYGAMVNCDCNIAGTMLSIIERSAWPGHSDLGVLETKEGIYFAFDPDGKYVWLNSDGTGTKPLIASRFPTDENFRGSVDDVLAMQVDDWAKFGMSRRGSGPVAAFNVLETTGDVPYDAMLAHHRKRTRQIGCASIFQREHVGDRLVGPNGEKSPFNISGSIVSAFDKTDLENLPTPAAGDTLVAIRANGGRSNGFTDRRKLMVQWYGKDWHTTAPGRECGAFLAKPSIIFYPAFVELISTGLATGVFHMSGGAYRDKLGKVLAKYGLYTEIGISGDHELFEPHPVETKFALEFDVRDSYTKFALGNEGFVSTRDPQGAIATLRKYGLYARVVSVLEKRPDRVGLKLRAFDGSIIDFSQPAGA